MKKKLVQICDETKHEYKNGIISLRTQLEKERRIEEMRNSKLKEKEVQGARLEVEIS